MDATLKTSLYGLRQSHGVFNHLLVSKPLAFALERSCKCDPGFSGLASPDLRRDRLMFDGYIDDLIFTNETKYV